MERSCLNNFCIYQKGGVCSLDEISVSVAGICADMVFINIDGNYLESRKKEILKEFFEVLHPRDYH